MAHEDYMYYWSLNQDMPKDEFDYVLQLNIDASKEYHLYHTDNNEGC